MSFLSQPFGHAHRKVAQSSIDWKLSAGDQRFRRRSMPAMQHHAHDSAQGKGASFV
jgi:hypothetical protein